mmetsp:Transcript_31418/g.82079  ORF Transcript_31418/g.82079 Transcript_31418/m.82079 type:complete len:84 (-) Transcript_31418:223-474(-)
MSLSSAAAAACTPLPLPPPPPPPVRAALPDRWEEHQTDGGDAYFYDTYTGQSQWTRPDAYSSACGEGVALPAYSAHGLRSAAV